MRLSIRTSVTRTIAIVSLLCFVLSTILKENLYTESRIHNQSQLETNRIIDKYLDLLEMAVTGSLYQVGSCAGENCNVIAPYNKTLRDIGNDWPPYAHTMVGHRRLKQLRRAIVEVHEKNISGHIVELGVWRGGACIYSKGVLEAYGIKNRKVVLFDAFDTLSIYGSSAGFIGVSENQVRENFKKYGLFDEGVFLEKGLFNKTTVEFFKNHPGFKTSVLRIDSNFYNSHMDILYNFYESVPVGGIIIFDDINLDEEVSRAWKDFQVEQGVNENLNKIDLRGAWLRKTKDVHIDKSLRKVR